MTDGKRLLARQLAHPSAHLVERAEVRHVPGDERKVAEVRYELDKPRAVLMRARGVWLGVVVGE